MRPEDLRYHQALFDQVTADSTPFRDTANVIRMWRRDLAQLFQYGRVDAAEYAELDKRYQELQALYPLEHEEPDVQMTDEPFTGRIEARCKVADMFPKAA